MQDHPNELAVSFSKNQRIIGVGMDLVTFLVQCPAQSSLRSEVRPGAQVCVHLSPVTLQGQRLFDIPEQLGCLQNEKFSLFSQVYVNHVLFSLHVSLERIMAQFSQGPPCRFEGLISIPKVTSTPGTKAPVPQLLLTGHAPAPWASWWSFTE